MRRIDYSFLRVCLLLFLSGFVQSGEHKCCSIRSILCLQLADLCLMVHPMYH